ncbi:MAG TPA: beta-N-acetylhexosaminidase, partial [Myxococcaceae bacterium]|nr:beta-N-acetylhexosaminidase [Myxococcaceae bacterium]
MVGFSGRSLDDGVRQLLGEGIFGAVFFSRNIGEPRELAELCREIKRRAPGKIILAVDQEGGRVARLRGEPFTALPPMRQLGLRGDAA